MFEQNFSWQNKGYWTPTFRTQTLTTVTGTVIAGYTSAVFVSISTRCCSRIALFQLVKLYWLTKLNLKMRVKIVSCLVISCSWAIHDTVLGEPLSPWRTNKLTTSASRSSCRCSSSGSYGGRCSNFGTRLNRALVTIANKVACTSFKIKPAPAPAPH